METEDPRDAFGRLYYPWALEQSFAERAAGFPHFRSFPTGMTLRFLALSRRLSDADSETLSRALAKRSVPDSFKGLAGGAHTVQEDRLIQEFLASMRWPAHADIWDAEIRYKERLRDGTIPRLKRKLLAREIRRRLQPLCADKPENSGGGVWKYTIRVRNGQIWTFLDNGGNFHDLSYWHNVVSESGLQLLEYDASLFSWMGLASMTMWNDLSEADLNPVADCVVDLVGIFVSSIQSMLERLPG